MIKVCFRTRGLILILSGISSLSLKSQVKVYYQKQYELYPKIAYILHKDSLLYGIQVGNILDFNRSVKRDNDSNFLYHLLKKGEVFFHYNRNFELLFSTAWKPKEQVRFTFFNEKKGEQDTLFKYFDTIIKDPYFGVLYSFKMYNLNSPQQISKFIFNPVLGFVSGMFAFEYIQQSKLQQCKDKNIRFKWDLRTHKDKRRMLFRIMKKHKLYKPSHKCTTIKAYK